MPEENLNDGQNANATEQTMADLAAGIQANNSEDGGSQDQELNNNQSQNNQTDMEQFIQTQSKQMESLQKEVQGAKDLVTEVSNREQQAILNKAVDDAIANITDGAEGKTKLADTFLNTEYRNNKEFAKIFDARNEHPDAYAKALGILKDEFTAMTQNLIDPQIAENQRALQDSQRGGQTVADATETDRLSKLPDGDFMREMRQLAKAG